MKKLLIIPVLAVILFAGCTTDQNKDTVVLQPYTDAIAALNDINLAVVQKFNEYDNEMAYAALRLDREGLTAKQSEFIVNSLQKIDGYVRLAGILDTSGRLLYVYPGNYYKDCGDGPVIKDAEDIMKKISCGQKVLSGTYLNRCQEMVVDYVCPVKGRDEIVHGAIYIQIAITEMMRHFVSNKIVGMPLNVWIVQTDGLIIYDTDPTEININILTSDYFRSHPSLIAVAQKITNYETGTGEYTYVSKGNKVELRKTAQWNSVGIGGRQLRIVLNVEDRSFVK